MTTKIQREFDFYAASHIGTFVINHFKCGLFMEVDTDSPHEQNVAMDRLKIFIYELLNNSVFVNRLNKSAIANYTKAGLKVCTTPEEPHDQIIAVALLLKLNAIVEGRMVIPEVVLSSSTGDGVSFIQEIDDPQGPFDAKGWWNRPDISMTDGKPQSDKVVSIFDRTPSWDELGLSWKEKDLVLVPDTSTQTP
jgi:hypothetical protein